MGELRNNEQMLRKTFTKHADGRSALLSGDKIPAILQDLGLPGHLPDMVDAADMEGNTVDAGDELSFHQTVNIVNKCIATHEANRDSAPANPIVNKVGERLAAALQYSLATGEEDASSDDDLLKGRAQGALEAALFGDVPSDNDVLKGRAQGALEAALFGDVGSDGDIVNLSLRAQGAVEAALFGDDDLDTPRTRAKMNARQALEAAFFGDCGDDDADICARAQDALEAALFGDDVDTPRTRAKYALEAALLGEDLDTKKYVLEAALLEEDHKMRARSALEAVLLGEDE